MREKPYYSVRTGKNPTGGKFDLKLLSEMVSAVYEDFSKKDYFGEAFGYYTSVGKKEGKLSSNIRAYVRRQLRKPINWPIDTYYPTYTEDDLFDIIELLYDCVSKSQDDVPEFSPLRFDTKAGQKEFRAEINALLQDYNEGYELSEEGEIFALPGHGLEPLLQATLPDSDPDNVNTRVSVAIQKFRSRHSSPEDRRDAIRDLADVLEFIRPKVKEILTRKDEGDLFNIANNFAIRHHNDQQKADYDKPIWYSWMFYFYLATIHASLRLIEKYDEK